MAQVMIVEENNHRGFQLKKGLEADGHQVTVCLSSQIESQPPRAEDIDIVLINWSCSNGHGWDVFNRLKDTNNKMAMMLYLLEDCKGSSLQWLRDSIQEALNASKE